MKKLTSYPKISAPNVSPRHIILQLFEIKDKEAILKAPREKNHTNEGTSIRPSTDFLVEILQIRKEWDDILKVLKFKNKNKQTQIRILYPDRERKKKTFTKQKLRESITNQTSITRNDTKNSSN